MKQSYGFPVCFNPESDSQRRKKSDPAPVRTGFTLPDGVPYQFSVDLVGSFGNPLTHVGIGLQPQVG